MKTLSYLGILILLFLPIAVAVDFTPSGNINGRNIYSIYNFTNITARTYYGDGSKLSGLTASNSNYSQFTNISNLQSLNDSAAIASVNDSVTSIWGALYSIGFDIQDLFALTTDLNNSKLDKTDQRYNDTTLINTKANSSLHIDTTGPLFGGGDLSLDRTIYIAQSNNTTGGFLTAMDWNTFNDKMETTDQRYNDTSLINAVNTSSNIIQQYGKIQKDPQGFEYTTNTELNTQSTLLFNDATRNFTISPIGSYTFYIGGVLYNNTVNKSLVISNTTGVHIIYFTPSNVLAETSVLTETILCSNAIVAIVFYDQTKQISLAFEDERHSHFMECVTHLELHENIGTSYESGLALTNVTVGASANLNQSAQLGVTAGQISDEDLHHDITAYANPATIKTYYSWGAAGNWSFKYDKFPMCYSGACGYTGASGRLGANTGLTTFTQCGTNQYILTHIFANNAVNSSQDIFAVTGTTCYSSTALATTGASNELATIMSTNQFNAEIKPLYSLLLLTTTGATNPVKGAWAAPSTGGQFIDYRETRVSGVSGISQSGTVTNVGTDTTLTVDGVTGATITGAGTLGVDNTFIQQFNDTTSISAVGARVTSLNSTKANSANPIFTGTGVAENFNFTGIVWINNINSTNTTGFSAASSFIENNVLLINKYATITALNGVNTTANNALPASDQRYNESVRITTVNATAIAAMPKTGGQFTGPINVTGNVNITGNLSLGNTIGQILFGNGGGYSWNTTDSCLISPANTTNSRQVLCVTKPSG